MNINFVNFAPFRQPYSSAPLARHGPAYTLQLEWNGGEEFNGLKISVDLALAVKINSRPNKIDLEFESASGLKSTQICIWQCAVCFLPLARTGMSSLRFNRIISQSIPVRVPSRLIFACVVHSHALSSYYFSMNLVLTGGNPSVWDYLKCCVTLCFLISKMRSIIIAKISVYKHWRHFRSRGSKSLVRVVGKRAFEPVKSFAHRRISNTIFGRCRYSNFLQTLTVKHFHNILTFFVVSEWNLAYKWSDSRLKYAKTQSFLLFLSLFANHEYCVTVLVTSLISSTNSGFWQFDADRAADPLK